MGFADKAKDMLGDAKAKAEDLAETHGDQIEGAIDKAAEMATERTGADADSKIAGAADKAKDLLGKLGGDDDPAGGLTRPDTPNRPG